MPDKQPPDPVAKAAHETEKAAKVTVAEIEKQSPTPAPAPEVMTSFFDRGFWRAILIGVIGTAVSGFVFYLGWLGKAIIGMDKKLDAVATNVQDLLTTRDENEAETAARTADQIRNLQAAAKKAEDEGN